MANPTVRIAALATLTALGGCATHGLDPRAWQITPVYRVQHAQAQFDGHYATGRYLEGQQRWAQAEQAYRRALAAQPEHVEARNRLAIALAEQGHMTLAIEALRDALVFEPKAAHLLNNLGYLQLRTGQREAAAATLQQALALNPHSAATRANLRAALSDPAAPGLASPPPASTPGEPRADVRPVAAGHIVTTPLDGPSPPLPPSSTATPPLLLQSPTVPALPLQAFGQPLPAAETSPHPPETTAPAPRPSADTRPSPAVAQARIELSNGNGVGGFAARVRGWLGWMGVKVDRLTNQRPYRQATTLVQYREGYEAQARELARQLPLVAQLEARSDLDPRADVRVLLGHDFRAHQAACLDTRRCAPPPAVAAASGEALPQ